MDGVIYRTNPMHAVTPWARGVVRLHHQTQSGMGGRTLLPEAGGLLDQCAYIVQALDVAASCDAKPRAEAADG